MEPETKRSIVSMGSSMLHQVMGRIKLVYYLMDDRRVNLLLKLIPIGSLAYFVLPDLAIGPIDDATVIWLATTLFVELCPDDIVLEHMQRLGLAQDNLPVQPAENSAVHPLGHAGEAIVEEEIIEGQFRPVDDAGAAPGKDPS